MIFAVFDILIFPFICMHFHFIYVIIIFDQGMLDISAHAYGISLQNRWQSS